MKPLATLRNFSDTPEDTLRTRLGKVAADLHRSPLSGKLVIHVTSDDDTAQIDAESTSLGGGTDLVVDLDAPTIDEREFGSATVGEKPAFIMYVREEALLQILSGELSPVGALDQGQLRYCGDERLGVAIFRRLADTQNAVFEPCRL